MAWERHAVEVGSAMIKLKNILVLIDFSEISQKALNYAVPLAKQFNAKITLQHAERRRSCKEANRVEVWFADLPKVLQALMCASS
jgi:nucleotide-binding universal stress UspA family protein